MRSYSRYVALGDSTTEGLEDPDGRGGYRGWADRFAEHLATAFPELAYANLAVRGLAAAEIEATQLAPALAMAPDLATVVAGMNDLLRADFSAVRIASHIDTMIAAFAALGATVITFTLPDVSRRMRLGGRLAARTEALNVEIRRVAAARGAIILDLAVYPLSGDPRMWADDRLHGNPEGHARIAGELAHLLGLPGAPASQLGVALPEARRPTLREVLTTDARWILRYVAPFVVRKLRRRTAGHGLVAKRPTLTPVR